MTPRAVPAAVARREWRTVLVLVFVTAVPAAAQRAREEARLEDERAALEQHGREVLHRGEPLQLVGVGDGDPDVLVRTPALATATLGLVRVDRDELHARKLAMYDDGARFDGAPRTLGPATPVGDADDALGTAPVDAAAAPVESAPTTTTWPWVAATLAALALTLWLAFGTRSRRPEASRGR